LRERTSKERSRAQEKRVARSLGGRVQPGSGNGHHRKEDIDTGRGRFLIEAKCRRDPAAASISLKLSVLEENERSALVASKTPAVTVELGGRDWYVLPDWAFAELAQGWER
jgi:hypothetical protein